MQHVSILRLGRALRRHASNRLEGRDSGAVATIVAILFGFGVVLGCAALTIDAGSLMWERRQLQNGADAASLAAAKVCASTTPCNPTPASLMAIAGANAFDGTSSVDSVCGSPAAVASNPALRPLSDPLCSPSGPNLTQCPAVPPGLGANSAYVEVHTSTRTAGGSSTMPRYFAASSNTVRACARAAWVTPSGGTVVPITMSLCEYNNYTANGTSLVPSPPYSSGYPPTPLVYEHAIYFHDTSGSSHCPAGPSGADLPGGFGWLSGSSNCSVTIDSTGWVDDKTGVSQPSGCDMSTLIGTTIYLPIFVNTNGLTGTNGEYLIDGFAAFYLTGGRFPSWHAPQTKSIATSRTLCTSSQTCLYGWFTSGLIPRAYFHYSPGPPDPRGASTVVLAG